MAKPNSKHRNPGHVSKTRQALDSLIEVISKSRRPLTKKQLREAVSERSKGTGDQTILDLIDRLTNAGILFFADKVQKTLSLADQWKEDLEALTQRAHELIFPTGAKAAA